MLDRGNDLLGRIDRLDDAVGNLQAFQSLLWDLNRRDRLTLSQPQVHAIEMVRAGILRSTIALIVAILDSKGRDRASLGQIVELLKDQSLRAFLKTALYKGRGAIVDIMKLQEVCDRYKRIYTTTPFAWVQQLRHDEVGHLLMKRASAHSVQYSDVSLLVDEIEQQVLALYAGLGIKPPWFTASKQQSADQARLFWDTYFAGVSAMQATDSGQNPGPSRHLPPPD